MWLRGVYVIDIEAMKENLPPQSVIKLNYL
jgi:hypothetical protein